MTPLSKIFHKFFRKADAISRNEPNSDRKRGRPRVEDLQPGFLEAIEAIASSEGAADPKRRSEMLTLPKTLDELHKELLVRGFLLG